MAWHGIDTGKFLSPSETSTGNRSISTRIIRNRTTNHQRRILNSSKERLMNLIHPRPLPTSSVLVVVFLFGHHVVSFCSTIPVVNSRVLRVESSRSCLSMAWPPGLRHCYCHGASKTRRLSRKHHVNSMAYYTEEHRIRFPDSGSDSYYYF